MTTLRRIDVRWLGLAVLLIGAGHGHAQTTDPPRSHRDSVARHTAYDLVADHEHAAEFDVRSPTAGDCEFTSGLHTGECGGVRCIATDGKAPCFFGRYAACQGGENMRNSYRLCVGEDAQPARDSTTLNRFLAELDSISRVAPTDSWIAGQTVYEWTDADQWAKALAAADRCQAESGWCALLQGFALARAGRLDSASTIFGQIATAFQGKGDACDLDDISALLDDPTQTAYAALPCGSPARLQLESRFWWLSDPSWLVPGNDRLVEHHAREVEKLITEDWITAYCGNTPRCNKAIEYSRLRTDTLGLLRHGPNDSWFLYEVGDKEAAIVSDCRKDASSGFTVCNMGSEISCNVRLQRSFAARYHFAPTMDALRDPGSATTETWDLNGHPALDFPAKPRSPSLTPRTLAGCLYPLQPERYTPPYAGVVTSLPHYQWAYFRRADSALVVGAIDANDDSIVRARSAEPSYDWRAAAFAFGGITPNGPPTDSTRIAVTAPTNGTWHAILRTRWDSLVLGFEMLGPANGHAPASAPDSGAVLARLRVGAHPPGLSHGRISLSDVLLLSPDGPRPSTLLGPGGAANEALGTTDLGPEERVGLYWEAYGLTPNEPVTIDIAIRSQRPPSLWQRLTFRHPIAMALSFTDRAPAGPADSVAAAAGRSVILDLRSLPVGPYTISLTATGRDKNPVTVTRDFTTR